DACAEFLAQLAERTIGHPCHRGDEKVVTQGETGKLHGVMGKRKRGILPYRPCVCACWGGRATRWRREVSRRSSVVMWLRGRLARGILRVEGGVGRGAGSRGRSGGRRLHSRPFAALRAALGGGRRGGGDANSALRASDMRRLVSPAPPSTSALVKLASATPAPRPCVGEWLEG